MRQIAIVGAGELGGATAHAVARRDVARTITLVDERGTVAAGKALDILQAAPVEGFATQIGGATDLSAVAGADVIVVADRFGAGEWQGEEAAALTRRLIQMSGRAIVVAAGASGGDVVDRAVREMKRARERVIGSAPHALAAAARALVALAIRTSPADVALSVVGVPPARTVVLWDDATAGGVALSRLLDEPVRRSLDAKIAALWPPGPYALGTAAAHVVAAIGGRSRQLATCFVAPDATAAARTRTAAMPVRLGPSGIVEVVTPSLSVGERVALENAIAI